VRETDPRVGRELGFPCGRRALHRAAAILTRTIADCPRGVLHDSPHADHSGGRIDDLRRAVFDDRRYEAEKVSAKTGAPHSNVADADTLVRETLAAVVSSAPGEGERSTAVEAAVRILETANLQDWLAALGPATRISLPRDRSPRRRRRWLVPVPRRLVLDVEPRRVDSAVGLFL
jgi:hypothetical protein